MYTDIFMNISTEMERLGVRHGTGDFQGKWENKYALNTPGPLYSGDVDNSGPGPNEAPNNIWTDSDGFPFLFRQPVNSFELRQVLLAAERDTFSSYGADGNLHWTLASVRAWWGQRGDIAEEIARQQQSSLAITSGNNGYIWRHALERWTNYLHGEMELYLRVYSYFLEEGHIPQDGDRLPDL